MFIPYRDVNPSGGIPYVTVGLIVVNALVFLGEITASRPGELFMRYGLTPGEFVSSWRTGGILSHALLPLFTNIFMHAGWMHIAVNMLYLWIFGDNVEDRLGHAEFLVFYLISGIMASLAHVIAAPGSGIPLVGASGAISGVLAAYVICFPRARVWVLVFFRPVEIRAAWFMGIWFAIQLVLGVFGAKAGSGGGVAYMAHIGGFVIGLILIFLFPERSGFRDRSDRGERLS
ncbi:MAG: rhomboid family intramembrane serine protease [Thermodesulfobacteriota bacterium]